MKVSLSWLSQYVAVTSEVPRLAEGLTMAGLEVDAVSDRYDYLESVVVARVASVRPHPQADRLSICTVDDGSNRLEVVCGAPNVVAGMRAPLARTGSVLPDGFKLTESVIRGVRSQGMLCSQFELGLGEDRSGLLVLPETLALGQPLNRALQLSDPVLDVDLTPNRPDCLSLVGIAREIAAIHEVRLQPPQVKPSAAEEAIRHLTSVNIEDPDLCPRYAARLIEKVTVGPSPAWLRDRLLSVGQRSINNIVDVTNFVMLELGQPLHAFDFDRLTGGRIVVRRAKAGEVFVTLDQKERLLTDEMLMICDAQMPVAIGGVMGGRNSEIEAGTTRVFLESAYFNPISIRKTAKGLGLATEASHRFERGVDPHGTLLALNRAARLIAEVGAGRLVEGFIDEHPRPTPICELTLEVAATNRVLGSTLTAADIQRLLASIGFAIALDEHAPHDRLTVRVPSFRVDVQRPEDLMEEVARLWGYHRIPVRMPRIAPGTSAPTPVRTLRQRVRSLLSGSGFSEAINYSFISADACDLLRLAPNDRRRSMVRIRNPLSEEQAVMRPSLVPGLLATVGRNLAQQTRTQKLFEVGNVFIGSGMQDLPEEVEMLAGAWTGQRVDNVWYAPPAACDFFDLKGAVEDLLGGLRISGVQFQPAEAMRYPFLRPGVMAAFGVGEDWMGVVGEVHPEVARRFDLKQSVFIFETSLPQLQRHLPRTITGQPVPRFPSTARDLTVIVDREVTATAVMTQMREVHTALVEDVRIFDVFEGEPIPAGKKSLSFRVTYRSTEATLEDEAVNALHSGLSQRLVERFGARLPSGGR
jgi:phenylalanyl-tRNA synthetase beta chain